LISFAANQGKQGLSKRGPSKLGKEIMMVFLRDTAITQELNNIQRKKKKTNEQYRIWS
jgi:hypothetical protein